MGEQQYGQEQPMTDEINFLEYIDVLLRRRYLILLFGLGTALAAFATALLIPKMYLVQTSLQLGRINGELVESQAQIKGRIEGDVYGIKIRETLDIPEAIYPRVIVEIPNETSIVRAVIESDQPETAKRILEELDTLIISSHQEIIQKVKKDIADRISFTRSNIQTTEQNISRLQKKISFLEQEKSILEDKISALQSQLIYEQTPGTQFALFNAREQLEQKRQEIENRHIDINNQRDRMISLQSNIREFESSIEGMKNTFIARVAGISENPIDFRPLFNAFIGLILGILLGVFAAFGKELWNQRKHASR